MFPQQRNNYPYAVAGTVQVLAINNDTLVARPAQTGWYIFLLIPPRPGRKRRKQLIEKNTTLSILSIVLGGFLAGIAAYKFILETANLESIQKGYYY